MLRFSRHMHIERKVGQREIGATMLKYGLVGLSFPLIFFHLSI